MTPGEKQMLADILDELQPEVTTLGWSDAERRLAAVLQPLLESEGYSLRHAPVAAERGYDAIAHRPATDLHLEQNLLVEFKVRRGGSRLTLNDIGRFLVGSVLQDATRALIVTNAEFSSSAQLQVAQFVQRIGYKIDLLGLADLRTWISRLDTEDPDLQEEALVIVQTLAREFAEMIARNVRALEHVEWRDLERVVAEVFEGLGFEAELTPSSKDEGKDVILTCTVKGKRRSYIVEVKHWRSGVRVGGSAVRDFVDVVAREVRDGGVFLSTFGYSANAFESITEIERQRVRFGGKEKVAALCRKYTRAAAGLWSPPEVLADIIFEDTA